MSAFRRRNFSSVFTSCSGCSSPILDVVNSSIVENGVCVNREVIVSRTPEEYLKDNPPPVEDYSINDQLAAGVPLKEIGVSSRFDSSDNLDYPENDYAEEKLLKQLQDLDTNSDNNFNNNSNNIDK